MGINISESMKQQYDVVAVKGSSGNITVSYKKPEVGEDVRHMFLTNEEFNSKMAKLGLRGLVLENING